jgi:CheY-like chemotaxis protein
MNSSKKILVVEDETSQLEVLCEKLSKEGLLTLKAKNGEEGLSVALEEHPDAILLDIMMPKMNGLDMAKKLREDSWGKKVPILVLTNSPDMKKVQQAVENEIFEYFIKSDTKIEHIVERVKELVK